MYRSLDASKIIDTAQSLRIRISERFPDSGLSKVADELLLESRAAAVTAAWLAAPLVWIRVLAWLGIAIVLVVTGATLLVMNRNVELFASVADFFQGLDAAVNDVILLGVAIYFLLGLERRLKRTRAARAIHVLRSMAHIIDMHQLTKDPDMLADARTDTPSSPTRQMSPFELTRYLDYCSEMLAILSKIAALYVQQFNDPVTLSAVNEVEDLTSGLSRKVWQKIMILDRMMSPR